MQMQMDIDIKMKPSDDSDHVKKLSTIMSYISNEAIFNKRPLALSLQQINEINELPPLFVSKIISKMILHEYGKVTLPNINHILHKVVHVQPRLHIYKTTSVNKGLSELFGNQEGYLVLINIFDNSYIVHVDSKDKYEKVYNNLLQFIEPGTIYTGIHHTEIIINYLMGHLDGAVLLHDINDFVFRIDYSLENLNKRITLSYICNTDHGEFTRVVDYYNGNLEVTKASNIDDINNIIEDINNIIEDINNNATIGSEIMNR